MLKRYDISLFTILMLLLAASLVSCEKESHEPASDKTPIKFGKVETRTPVNSVDDMKGSGFGVLASMNGAAGTSAAAVYSLFMENENVYWDDTYDAWTYDNTQYWTKGRNYHFFAYHPYEAEMNDAKPISAVEMNAYFGYDLTFTTPQKADFDLLTGFATVDTGDAAFNGGTPVSIDFGHEMVNVNLEIWCDAEKHQNDNMRVTGVALTNIPWKGELTKTVDGVSSWTPLATNPLFERTVAYQIEGIGAARKDLTWSSGDPCKPFGSDGVLLIPEANAVTLIVSYELHRQDGGDIWEEYTLPVTLPVDSWEAGKRINYSLILSNQVNMSFYYLGTTVQPWGAPQVGGTIIIK